MAAVLVVALTALLASTALADRRRGRSGLRHGRGVQAQDGARRHLLAGWHLARCAAAGCRRGPGSPTISHPLSMTARKSGGTAGGQVAGRERSKGVSGQADQHDPGRQKVCSMPWWRMASLPGGGRPDDRAHDRAGQGHGRTHDDHGPAADRGQRMGQMGSHMGRGQFGFGQSDDDSDTQAPAGCRAGGCGGATAKATHGSTDQELRMGGPQTSARESLAGVLYAAIERRQRRAGCAGVAVVGFPRASSAPHSIRPLGGLLVSSLRAIGVAGVCAITAVRHPVNHIARRAQQPHPRPPSSTRPVSAWNSTR